MNWITAYSEAEEMTVFEQDEFIAQGDKVVMLGHCETRTKVTNKNFATNLVHIIPLKTAKLRDFSNFSTPLPLKKPTLRHKLRKFQ